MHLLRNGSPDDHRAALDQICRAYWSPLYFVARSKQYDTHDAQDLVQGFFESLLRRDALSKVDPNAGKLRQLLLRAFENYRCQQWHKTARIKRGGGVEHIQFADWMDTEEAERHYLSSGVANGSAEAIFNKEWANSLLKRSLNALQSDYERRGWGQRFETLVALMLGKDGDQELAVRAMEVLGMSNGALRVTLHRMRRHYRDKVEREIGLTLGTEDPVQIKEEMMQLFQAVA